MQNQIIYPQLGIRGGARKNQNKQTKREELPWDPCCTDWFWNWAYGLFGIPENCCPFGDWLCDDGEPCFCNREGGTNAFRGLTSGEIMLGASLEKKHTEKLHISHHNMGNWNTWMAMFLWWPNYKNIYFVGRNYIAKNPNDNAVQLSGIH